MEKTPPIETTLYGGKVTVKFFPDSHIYMVKEGNGDWFRPKSVTGITGIVDKSTQLVSWSQEEAAKSLIACIENGVAITEEEVVKAAFASEQAKIKAANIGDEIHDWIEQHIKAELKQGSHPEMPEDKNILIGVNSFLEWESGMKLKYLWSEKMVYSKKHGYVGKADFAFQVGKKKYIADNKTGNGLYNGVLAQTAAYQSADEEETGGSYDGRYAIRISKETEKEYLKRMLLKNKIKRILGKKESATIPYKVFDAQFLDESVENYRRDMKGFVNMIGTSLWNSETTNRFR